MNGEIQINVFYFDLFIYFFSANMIDDLYSGKIKSYVKCTACNYTSTGEEKFLDLSLNIREVKHLEDSFEK